MSPIIPGAIIIIGTIVGGGIGYVLSPTPNPIETCNCDIPEEVSKDSDNTESEQKYEYADIKNQFIIPVIEENAVNGMVVLSLSLEVEIGTKEMAYSREPKLRDEFLRLLFAYASIGGFSNEYIEVSDIENLKRDLTKAAKKILGPIVNQVLVIDMIRQDI